MEKERKLYTIGYEGITLDAFLNALKREGVETLIDVRAVPLSRKPGFSKNKLAEALKKHGISYVGLKGLGTPAAGRDAARKGRMSEMRAIFDAHLTTTMAIEDMERAIETAKASRSCLLCFEHNPACCHRQIVADVMSARMGSDVRHLHPMHDVLL